MTAKSIAKKHRLSLSAIRLIPHIFLMKYHPSREIIEQDLERWSIESFKRKKPETDMGHYLDFHSVDDIFT